MSNPKVTIVKRFTWRGTAEEWSNSYSFSGPVPADNTEWLTLCNAIADSEVNCYMSSHAVVTYYGYADGDQPSVFQYDFAALGQTPKPGKLTGASGEAPVQGDGAAWVRCLVGQSSKGKNVYVRKYFHGVWNSGDPDTTGTRTVTNLGAHANLMISGNLPGGRKWCSPTGRAAIAPYVGRFITTRTLKRRGKRP